MKSTSLLALILLLPLCLQFHLPLASSHTNFHIHRSSSSIPGGLESLTAGNVAVVKRKGGGGGGGGHGGGGGGGGHGGGGRGRIMPYYGGNGGSHRSNGRQQSGSNRLFAGFNLNVSSLLLFTVFITSLFI